MNIRFNADQILQMSVRIEQNGARFYREAAERVEDSKDKLFLLQLANFEDQHEEYFSEVRKALSEAEREELSFDPDNQGMAYCQNHADLQKFFDKDVDFTRMKDVLESAIQQEKDSIVFYLGLRDYVPARFGKERIDAIIQEEMSHINILTSRLNQL